MRSLDSLSYEPVLVDAKTAASLCGVSRSNWLSWDSAGLCPRPNRINGRVLWSVDLLKAWAKVGCPSREQFEAGRAALMEGRSA